VLFVGIVASLLELNLALGVKGFWSFLLVG
jgi:hypothetical protein